MRWAARREHVGETAGIERRPAVLSVRQFARRAEQAKSERERVLLRGVCDLVDENSARRRRSPYARARAMSRE